MGLLGWLTEAPLGGNEIRVLLRAEPAVFDIPRNSWVFVEERSRVCVLVES